ncbi:hypothetical protein BU24DRAFT_392327 [Aaosphaeria arxii CBS 175.79]|uniref:Alpha/beta hydrolase fold-3 domain-containing protein n=1 Tax=Aaosphaeria arxii CBS 175.79 TaxID=1450172 RepID=A0A6A5XLP8_9PLEO|nr:uncharacterized protein BU24DRAFT_392327 [Aaosphaeria arxii CBS 175.79]KAF2014198.1 hypothetical protein BU24DRAFT_392327 [Aaosphaeria arxii CBS 175.79]
MDISPLGVLRAVIPELPRIVAAVGVALLRIFSFDRKWPQDFITNIIVIFSRPVLGTPASILKAQGQWNTDFGIWGPMWISKVEYPKPEDYSEGEESVLGVKEAVTKAIRHLGNGISNEIASEVASVEAEWTGYRSGAFFFQPRPNLSEKEHYEKMMDEIGVDSPTILFFHGGAFCLMDPSSHRLTTPFLAKECKGRCLSVRFRLSPQHAFPAALQDAFVAYLSLLSPPPGAFHQPVSPSRILIAGDSSGASLGSSLTLLLMTLRRLNVTHIRFHGKDVDITGSTNDPSGKPLPPVAGLTVVSPYLDVSRSFPSVYRNAQWDILASPPTHGIPCPEFPPDAIWPANPPRIETYCESKLVIHPLVSPVAAKPSDWEGAPPVFVNVGWELMQDEAEVFARRLSAGGAKVVFDGYEGMPHCFQMMRWSWQGRRSLKNWGKFCRDAVNGTVAEQDYATWTTRFNVVKKLPLADLAKEVDEDVVDELLVEQRDRRILLEKELRQKP